MVQRGSSSLSSRLATLVAVFGFLIGGDVMGRGDVMADDVRLLADFTDAREQDLWRSVDDGVMGGLSQSRLTVTAEGTGVFTGVVSLENNGGFASVRRAPVGYGIDGFTGIRLAVRGDGKRYRFRARTDDRFDGVAYQADFATTRGAWVTVKIPFDVFQASWRGMRVPDAPRLDPGAIRQIGFLIADKQEGEFRLEVQRIEAYRSED
jgi:monofunctional biosynthetic peptidoglycan transglycosylase